MADCGEFENNITHINIVRAENGGLYAVDNLGNKYNMFIKDGGSVNKDQVTFDVEFKWSEENKKDV